MTKNPDMTNKEYRESLMEAYVIKSTVKQQVFNNTAESFLILKKVLNNWKGTTSTF